MSNQNDKAQDEARVEDEEQVVDIFAEEDDDTVVAEGEDNEEVQDKSQDETDEASQDDEDEFDLPEKFKGKSIEDIVTSYTNLEKEYGRRNSEVGQLRKLTDKLLDLERQPEKKEEAEDDTVDADSLLENPQESIRKILANDPTIKDLKEAEVARLRDAAKVQFETANPDYKKILKDDKFAAWVLKSDRRKETFVQADQNYDYATMQDMLTDYRELNPTPSAEEEAEDAAEKEEKKEKDRKKLATQKRSKGNVNQKKVYSREQLIHLKATNPEEYARRHDEFLKAYDEGRVR